MRTFLALLLLTSTVAADPPAELAPKRVTLVEKAYDVAEVLSAIKEQTGNPRLADRRSAGAAAKVAIGFADLSFWEALDRLAEKLDARVSPFSEDGVALVDGPGHLGKVAYSGIARAEIQTIDVRIDVATGRRTCAIEMEIAWEPRFEPLYLWLDEVAGFAWGGCGGQDADVQAEPPGSGRRRRGGAAWVDVTLDVCRSRSVGKIDMLDARVGFVGPTKMVRFEAALVRRRRLRSCRGGVDVTDRRREGESAKQLVDRRVDPQSRSTTVNFESYQGPGSATTASIWRRPRTATGRVWTPKPSRTRSSTC